MASSRRDLAAVAVEAVAGTELRYELYHLLLVFSPQVGRAGVKTAIALDQMRKLTLQERHKLLHRRGHEEQDVAVKEFRSCQRRAVRQFLKVILRVRQRRQNRHHVHTDSYSRRDQFCHSLEALSGRGRLGLEQARQTGVQGRDGDVHTETMLLGDLCQKVEITENKNGLGGDGNSEALEIREYFENTAGDPKLRLGRLIRIGRRTQRNRQSLVLGGAELGPQKLWR